MATMHDEELAFVGGCRCGKGLARADGPSSDLFSTILPFGNRG